jgi:hypothetical protein
MKEIMQNERSSWTGALPLRYVLYTPDYPDIDPDAHCEGLKDAHAQHAILELLGDPGLVPKQTKWEPKDELVYLATSITPPCSLLRAYPTRRAEQERVLRQHAHMFPVGWPPLDAGHDELAGRVDQKEFRLE